MPSDLSPETLAALPGLLALVKGQRARPNVYQGIDEAIADMELRALAPALARAVLAAEARRARMRPVVDAACGLIDAYSVMVLAKGGDFPAASENLARAKQAVDDAVTAYRALATPAREGGE